MPEFSDIQNVYSPRKKLNNVELLRSIKYAIAAEFEAIQLYQQMMESTDDEGVKRVLAEITNDEKHHAGGLYKLLEILNPADEEEYQIGAKETLENIVQ